MSSGYTLKRVGTRSVLESALRIRAVVVEAAEIAVLYQPILREAASSAPARSNSLRTRSTAELHPPVGASRI
jgi:hypothetical protein